MNANPHDFPIPYPSQDPADDLAATRMLLNAVVFYLEDGKDVSSSEATSLFNVLCAATEKLEVVQIFLSDVECPNLKQQYQAARRKWVLQNGGAE